MITFGLLAFGVGVVAGLVNIVAGGGSFLILPVLIFMGLPAPVANATNRVSIVCQCMVGIARFSQKGVRGIRYGLSLVPVAVIGAYFGTRLAIEISDETFKMVLGGLILIAVVVMVLDPLRFLRHRIRPDAQVVVAHGVFFGVGLYGGFINAGVGYVMLTVLTGVLGFDLVKSNLIKLVVSICYTVLSLGLFIANDMVHWLLGLCLAAGSMTGAWVGVHFSVKHGHEWLKKLVPLVGIGIAVGLLVL